MLKIKPNLKAIIWDFDGVILNSNKVRDQGFLEVLAKYDDNDVAKLMAYHQANGGLSRYAKFEYFFADVLKVDFGEQDIQQLALEFSEIMKGLLTNKDLLIFETINFIQNHFERIPMHIVSGSDGEELRYLCGELNISEFFRSIDGSPVPKIDNVDSVLQNFGYDRDHVVLIGDSINDFEAADKNGILFFPYNNHELAKLVTY